MSKELGLRIRQLRETKSLSIKKCSDLIGVSQSTLRDWEHGRDIQGEPYQRIAKVLGVSTSELLGLDKSEALVKLESFAEKLEKLQAEVRYLKSQF